MVMVVRQAEGEKVREAGVGEIEVMVGGKAAGVLETMVGR